MLAIVWSYRVRPEFAREFAEAYAPDGPWAQLFARAGGFMGVQLLEGTAATG